MVTLVENITKVVITGMVRSYCTVQYGHGGVIGVGEGREGEAVGHYSLGVKGELNRGRNTLGAVKS